MEAWVIKRDDGLYYNCSHEIFVKAIFIATPYLKYRDAERMIKHYQFDNCKPVKVQMEEIHNEKN